MIHHNLEDDALVTITQPAHAWLSGQMARAWGGGRFARPEPWAPVCLAAEQHDVGWTEWEAAPTLNPQTARPRAFTEMDQATHLDIWSDAASRVAVQSHYAALLISMHGTYLFGFQEEDDSTAEERRAAERFVARERSWQDAVRRRLAGEPRWGPHVEPIRLERNQRLMAVWDWMSLLLCRRVLEPSRIRDVPARDEACDLEWKPRAGESRSGLTSELEVVVQPWPFVPETLTLACEAKRIPPSFASDDELRQAISAAVPLPLHFQLLPE